MKNNHQRYLVLVHRNDNIPPSEFEFKQLQQLTSWFEQHHKQGNVECWGIYGLDRGGFGVWTVSSMDELHKIQNEAPYAPFALYKVYPLISGETFNASIKEAGESFARMQPVGAHR